MKFSLSIELGNEAFHPDWSVEVSRILAELAHSFSTDTVERGCLYDHNGNRCGFYEGPEQLDLSIVEA